MMSNFSWNIAIQELGGMDRKKQRSEMLSPVYQVKYHLHNIGDEYEILDKEVEFDTEYLSYDEESVCHWEYSDMSEFVSDHFPNKVGDEIVFKVELTTSYKEDYYGEVDVEVYALLLHGMVKEVSGE